MTWKSRSYPRAQPARVLLAQAKDGHLQCTRNAALNPTFTAHVHISDADRQAIFRYILDGVLCYERREPPHWFGVGRVQLTAYGRALLPKLAPEKADA